MDEPFGALDNVTRSKIHAEFKALDELKRKTIIMVTHDVQEAFELGDHICLMDQGHIVQDGKPANLLFKPANDFVRSFLQEQRLQLELRTIRMQDIWQWLPANQQESDLPRMNGETDMWTGMESFRYHRDDLVGISHQNQTRSVAFEQLMSAYYQYKSNLSHE
jgi:osmoprotectant transport system ATP-binding protein